VRLVRVLSVVLPLLVACLLADVLLRNLVGGGRLDPYLLLAVWHGAAGRKADGMLVGGLAGLVQDLMGSVVLGTHFTSKVVVGYLVMLLVERLIPGQLLTHAVLLTFGTLVEAAVLLGLGAMLGRQLLPGSLGLVLVAVALNALVGCIAFAVADRVRRRRERVFGRGARGR
jgi:rod shape-determining protein MreD